MDFNIVCFFNMIYLNFNWTMSCSLNSKAINIIYCALDRQLCDKILHFDHAYDIWNFLDNMYSVENSPCTTNDLFDVKENYNSQNQDIFYDGIKEKCDDSSLCLMAHSDNDSRDESDKNEVNQKSPSYDELYDAFENMQHDLEKLSSKYLKLSKKYKSLIIENKSLMDENACLKNGATIDLLNVDKFGDDEKCALNDRIKFL